MSMIRVACVAPALLAAAAPAFADVGGETFVDDFEHIDRDRWIVADGWSTGEWMANDWRAANVSTRGEGMSITLARKPDVGALIPLTLRRVLPVSWRQGISYALNGDEKHYSSGELMTREFYQYGYYEARLQAPRGSGLVTGFFTYGRFGDESTWDEIDIEILGRETTAMRVAYFSGGRNHIVRVPLGFDAADAEHSYGFDWDPKRIRWTVDGVVVHEERGDVLPLPRRPQRLTIDLWNTTTLHDWLGPIDDGEGPWTLRVSCLARAERYEGSSLCDADSHTAAE